MSKDLVCRKCGAINCTQIIDKGVHHTAFCSVCGAYIKNVAYNVPTIYFGKYKNFAVKDISDKDYLIWFLANIPKITDRLREAIEEQIRLISNKK